LSYSRRGHHLRRYAAVEIAEEWAVGYAELSGTYQRLRSELDAAYAHPIWNSRRIDEIADQMIRIERALASSHPEVSLSADVAWVGAGERGRDRATAMDR